MGFYPPSMLVREAQRMGVDVRPVDVGHSDWSCTLEGDAAQAPALRLGLAQVRGLSEAAGRRIVSARARAPFAHLADLVERAALDRQARQALAAADALAHLVGDRHAAAWAAAGSSVQGDLLGGLAAPEPAAALPAPSEGAEIIADYRHLGLTLRRHPLALLRERLQRRRVRRADELAALANGCSLSVAGLVMFRQRPQTASGLMFMTLEDETGIVNLIVSARRLEALREVLLDARLLLARGRLQNDGHSVHLRLAGAEDLSAWLGELPRLSRDFR
jgi:DNA polymerase III, alpha subunit